MRLWGAAGVRRRISVSGCEEEERTRRTFQLLLAPASTAKRAKAADKLLEINGPATTDRTRERRQRQTTWARAEERGECATHSSSKMAMSRDARGLFAIWGIWRNSSRSIDPEPSLSAWTGGDGGDDERGGRHAENAYAAISPVELHEALLEPLELPGVDWWQTSDG